MRRGVCSPRAAVLVIILVAAAGAGILGRVNAANVDAFYDPPASLPDAPGQLLRSEPFDRGLPDRSRAERILYTTTGIDGSIRVASGLVIAPAEEQDRPLPVLLWAHGATGAARDCAPSLLDDPLGSGAMPAQQEVVDRGWALIVPDYIGLGTPGLHPFLVGVPDARSSLDAVRAARQSQTFDLSDRTVVWGHSQGGAVALWIGIEARTYAPDVPLLGIAAMAPPSDLPGLASGLEDNPIGMLFGAFLLHAYSAVYPDVRIDDYLSAGAHDELTTIVGRCLSSPATWLSIGSLAIGDPLFRRSPADGPLSNRLEENVPREQSGVPTFVGQGEDDPLVSPAMQAEYVAGLCAAGQDVDYRVYDGWGHLDIVGDGSPMVDDLLAWTEARFAGTETGIGCAAEG